MEPLARAFHHDPAWVALFPDPARRAVRCRDLFGFMLKYATGAGEVWATPGFEGAAVWFPPGQAGPGVAAAIRNGGLLLPFRVGFTTLRRLGRMGEFIAGLRKQHCPEPHRYLAMLGVAPEYQGQGLGTQLLQPMLERSDREGLPVWLETETEANVRFYRGLGFEVRVEATAPGIEVRVWGMKRAARDAGGVPEVRD